MHQQVRTTTSKTGSSSPGPGAMADEGSLVDILTLLQKYNLRAAGGHDLDSGGVFVFAVDDSENDVLIDRVVKDLRDAGYRDADKYDVRECLVDDEKGALLRCIQDAQREGLEVYEIFVGTPEGERKIPIQITTREMVGARQAS